jgi:hypothetical protein
MQPSGFFLVKGDEMLRKLVFTSIVGCMLTLGAMAGEVVVRVGPPAAVGETRGPSPGAGYIYTKGYHRWDGNAYVWVPGEWRRPPHERAKWVDHRWEHRKDGYVFVEGHWR